MDAKLMNIFLFQGSQSVTVLVSAALYLIAGVGVGVLYFWSLHENTRLFAAGVGMSTAIMFMIGRFVLLAGILVFASREGAFPLLAMALGVLVARAAVLRRVRRGAP
jgi:N-ATPase, AtpR subunit